jgi:hypothetical protein
MSDCSLELFAAQISVTWREQSDKEKLELYETLSTIHATNIYTYFAYSMDALMIITV